MTHAIDAPEPGFYDAIPDALYHRWTAVGASTLTNLRRSPLYCRMRQTEPEPERTPAARAAMDFGSAVHCRLLEPEAFDSRYAFPDFRDDAGKPLHYNAREYKRQKAEAEASGVTFLPESRINDCHRIAESIFGAGELAADLLHGAIARERSYVAHDERTGIPIKARPDALCPGLVIDIKTTADPTASAFARSVANFGYHRQASLYLRVCNAIEPNEYPSHVILAIANTAPFEHALYALENAALWQGETEIDQGLKLYAHCMELDEWPGMDPGIQGLDLPAWAYR